MKASFQHIFPGTIQRISYFGKKNDAKIWLDVTVESEKKWFIIDIKSKSCREITNPFDSIYIYTWIDAIDDSAFFSILEQGKNPKSIGVYQIDLKTGTVLEKMDIFPSNLYINNKSSEIFTIENPTHYIKDDSYFSDFKLFFEKKFNQQIDKGIDYFEGKEKLIFSYYLYENTWVNRLKVCNLSFDILWDEQIDSNDLIGHHTFQVFENSIIYTKNKIELIILDNE